MHMLKELILIFYRYKQNAMRIANIAKDEMVPAMDQAVWWVEYVMRHNGAKHLRVASLDLSWYQLAMIDVYGFLLLVLAGFIFSIYFIIKSIIGARTGSSKNGKKAKLEKKRK